MARISQSYKSMLLAVLPLAVANSEAEHAVLAGIVDSLALIDEKVLPFVNQSQSKEYIVIDWS